MTASRIPLSAYVHLPWCVRKCPYCDFNSHEVSGKGLPEDSYISALEADIDLENSRGDQRNIETVFFGGGTPSLFSARGIDRVLAAFTNELGMEKDAEITLEANPGAVEAERFSEYRRIGINRLSIGVQSFNDEALAGLGRIHDSSEAVAAINIAQESGFDNLNIDLMHGLPGQDVTMALADLQTAVRLRPPHISWYQLTLEPNTVFYSKPPSLPTHEQCWEIQQNGKALLESEGYRQYEVSAWARDGMECRHNLNYWQFADYYGVGAGAHGKLSDTHEGEIKRYQRHRIPGIYMQKSRAGNAVARETRVSEEDLVLEFMMNSLRLLAGFSPGLFTERTGLDIGCIEHLLEQARSAGLLEWQENSIRASEKGMDFLNDLLAIFLPGVAKNE